MDDKQHSIAIIGLGHVGLPTLVYFDQTGYNAIGVDTNNNLLSALKDGRPEIIEPEITSEVCKRLTLQSVLPDVDTYFICIDIEQDNGVYEIQNLVNIIKDIDRIGTTKNVIIKSTIDNASVDQLRAMVKNCDNILAMFSPEFLREGHAMADMRNNPSYFGVIHKGKYTSAEIPNFIGERMYDCKSLTMLKVANNTWRATKVSFANLLMAICDNEQVDYDEVYKLFVADQLNTSKAYLKGGAPFGGYCLPKETAVLSKYEEKFGTQLLQNVIEINCRIAEYWVKKILSYKPRRVIFESLSFKSAVSDRRNSPMVSIRDGLISQGVDVLVLGSDIKVDAVLCSDLLVTNNPEKLLNTNCEVLTIAGV